jgi:hypothetical protein
MIMPGHRKLNRPGDRQATDTSLPGEPELADQYGVSRYTIRRAGEI